MGLEGQFIRLREERESDLEFLLNLRNTLETQGWSKTLPTDYTLPMYAQRYREREFSFDRMDGRFTIEHKGTLEPVGTVGYSFLEPRFSAMIGIAIAKKFWSEGFAFEAQNLLVDFIFVELGVRVIRLWTHSGNPKAVALAERAGFKVSVRQREAIFKHGQLFDNLVMDMLREEYYARHPDLEDKLPAPF